MYAENKFLDIILGILIFLMLLAILYLSSNVNEKIDSKKFFEISQFENNNYVLEDEGHLFKIHDNKLYLNINGSTIYSGAPFEFNENTGEFTVNDKGGDLYLRSVGNTNLVIWYKYAIYRLDKEIVTY